MNMKKTYNKLKSMVDKIKSEGIFSFIFYETDNPAIIGLFIAILTLLSFVAILIL